MKPREFFAVLALGFLLGASAGTSAFALWSESRDRVGVTVE